MDITGILVSREGKLNFLKGLIRVAKCDEKLDSQELVFYHETAQALGLDSSDFQILTECWNSNEKIHISFETKKEKMYFLMQAVQLCWMDNEYVAAEQAELRTIAAEIGIDLKTLEKIEEWSFEYVEWDRKGQSLLEL